MARSLSGSCCSHAGLTAFAQGTCLLFPLVNTHFVVPLSGGFMDPEWLLHTFGPLFLAVAALIIFVECAVFPVLPGDSLLFATGMFIAQPDGIRLLSLAQTPSLVVVCLLLFLAAIAGNVVGYVVGRRVSPWLFREREGLFGKIFSPQRLLDTQAFFERYGAKALVLGRFVPFVRTFVTMVAGAAGMRMRHFIGWTAVGAFAWAVLITVLGFFLGNIPLIRDNLEIALIVIVLVSMVPMAVEYLRERRTGLAA